MTVNIPVLRKMLEWVEEQDKLAIATRDWYQPDWFSFKPLEEDCGTQYCAAGYVVQLEGWEPYKEGAMDTTQGRMGTSRCEKHGVVKEVGEVATKILGVTVEESHSLFYGGNDARAIRRKCEEIAEKAGEKL